MPVSSSDGNPSARNMWLRNTEAQWPRTVSPHQPLPGGGGRDLSSPSSSLEGKPLKEQWTRRARTTGQPPLNRADTSRDADTAKSASALLALHPATEVHNRPHLQVRRQAQGLTPRGHPSCGWKWPPQNLTVKLSGALWGSQAQRPFCPPFLGGKTPASMSLPEFQRADVNRC